MSTTQKQDTEFLNSVIGTGLLESSIDWIKSNMSITEIFSEKELLDEAKNYDPEDVCSQSSLENWADNNGYIKE
ncbi:MAG: hypothetical protein V4547_09570 [Bacteroidota bacterium]